jgi:hypothetical protein
MIGAEFVIGAARAPIRLRALAAPEGEEPGGNAATSAMVELVPAAR